MTAIVEFVDTSVLCNLLDVPGKNQRRAQVLAEERVKRKRSTGSSLAKLASQKLGCGDLSILIERDRYESRTTGVRAYVWTLDEQLAAYS